MSCASKSSGIFGGCLLGLLVFGPSVSATGHDLFGVARTEAGDEAVVRDSLRTTMDSKTRQVIQRLNLWQNGKTIIVCFIGGNDEIHRKFAAIANEWASGNSLHFDFGSPTSRSCSGSDSEDIRVAFQNGAGSWSWIGIESHNHSGASMNLDLASYSSDEELRADVLHEFGHAIGFWHEQQHPDAPCDYNKTLVEKDYRMNDADYKVNMDKVSRDSREFIFSLYDKKSVMHYSLPAKYFTSGQNSLCYIPTNSTLSPGDLNAVRAAYPLDPNVLSQTRSTELDILHVLQGNKQLRTIVARRMRVIASEPR
jgi:hypothetical protein